MALLFILHSFLRNPRAAVYQETKRGRRRTEPQTGLHRCHAYTLNHRKNHLCKCFQKGAVRGPAVRRVWTHSVGKGAREQLPPWA